LADEMTTGFELLRLIIVGPCANAVCGAAAASPAAVPVMTNSRRLIVRGMDVFPPAASHASRQRFLQLSWGPATAPV
jgi:hypothetical protein